MPSPLLTVTLQAALFSLASTLLAQCITMYRAQTLGPINATSLIQFMLIAILMTPPNYGFQKWLEGRWPARPAGRGQLDGRTGIEKGNGKLDVGNTAKKFILDQSLGAAANTAGFIVLLNLLRGHGLHAATREVQKGIYPMMLAGWRFWPVVSLSNLVVVPFEYRMLVGNVSGLVWGTWVNLRML